MKKFTILFFLIFAQTIFCATSATDLEKQIQDHKSRSDSLQNLISQSEKKILELSQKENEQLSQLNEMEKIIETGKNLISIVEKQIDSLNIQKTKTANTLVQTQLLLNKRKEVMIKRLQNIYKMGDPTILSMMLETDSPKEIVSRIRYMRDLNKYDRNLLDTIRQNEQELIEQTKIYEAEDAHLQELLKERREESQKVSAQVLSRKKFLEELRDEKSKWEISMNEYKNAQTELSKMVEDLIVEISVTTTEEKSKFAEKKGKLPWATDGKVLTYFGKIIHPEYKTTIVNNGIDIEAPNGAAVKSVSSGVVEFVGRMRGYGKLMIINHFGGYLTIYAHLDQNFLEKGTRVTEGQKIGTVGESGSLEGNKLHFEIRHENNALDPMEWLKKL
ncbi:MAG: peptidoglycan DD-metalloendopeptidase family protein [Chitinivibrionia bacterium]|nr:peptidoglycan DD-metalloendopeptidase family protein [Chitinivibrionia bacterium]